LERAAEELVDVFGRADPVGEHLHDFTLHRRPDTVVDETGGLSLRDHRVQADFPQLEYKEIDDRGVCIPAGHELDRRELRWLEIMRIQYAGPAALADMGDEVAGFVGRGDRGDDRVISTPLVELA
jgi:hypothetical protein